MDRERHGAAAVVTRGSQVLLARRRNPPDAGLWGYPGGHVEAGETALEAASRELAEETGIMARPLGILTTLRTGQDGLRFRLDMVLCRYLSGDPVAADDVLAAEWVSFAEVEHRRRPMSRDVDTVLALALLQKPGTPIDTF